MERLPERETLKMGVMLMGFFSFVGFLVLLVGLGLSWESFTAYSWTKTEGFISTSKVVYSSSGQDYDPDGFNRYTDYLVIIDYTYKTPQGEFSRDVFSPNDIPCFVGECLLRFTIYDKVWQTDLILDKYPPGKRVTVYYNPKKPEKAFVYREPHTIGGVIILIGGTWFLVSLAFLLDRGWKLITLPR